MTYKLPCFALVTALIAVASAKERAHYDSGLVGYWKLAGDLKDHSGNGNHGELHRLEVESVPVKDRNSCVVVPSSTTLRIGTGDFSVAAWVHSERELGDAMGDVVNKYDGTRRTGFNLTVNASAAGYNSSSNTRHLFFGMDNGTFGEWVDCGRPGGKSHSSDALTVFNGDLYAGTTDGPSVDDWCHVYRYRGGKDWEDCGRVGSGKTRGVYGMIVHDGALYAATSASHGPQPDTMDYGRVYRYKGSKEWEDIGQPGTNYRLNSLATFQGRLYVTGFNIGSVPGYCYVYEGGKQWKVCGEFDGWPHTLAVHDGKLYTAYPKGRVFVYDGNTWRDLGNPFGSIDDCNQIHSLGVFQGELHAGTWPKGKVAVLRNGQWIDRGRPGDATEVIALAVYNGCLYAGTIPRAEVFRFDQSGWTSLRRIFDPPGLEPVPVGSKDWQRVSDWSRATSLAVYDGKLFVSSGTCHRTMIESPLADEVRGKVYSFETGACISYDRDLGSGWNHLTAIRSRRQLKLFVNGRLAARCECELPVLDIANNAPLRIGFGQQSYFPGKIREVRIYNRSLDDDEVRVVYRSSGIPDNEQ